MKKVQKYYFVIYLIIPIIAVYLCRLFRVAQGEKNEKIVFGIMVGVVFDLIICAVRLVLVKRKSKLNMRRWIYALTFLIVAAAVHIGYQYYTHNSRYKNTATEQGDYIILNGDKYGYISVASYKDYTISDVLICKTDNTKLYMISEYPDYEYIAVYFAWDGSIYKRIEDNNK